MKNGTRAIPHVRIGFSQSMVAEESRCACKKISLVSRSKISGMIIASALICRATTIGITRAVQHHHTRRAAADRCSAHTKESLYEEACQQPARDGRPSLGIQPRPPGQQ